MFKVKYNLFTGANHVSRTTLYICVFTDCMECMACSDNVVRAGLTPKFKDVPTLCSMLNYSCKAASENLFQPTPHPTDNHVTIYNPPIPDFAVARIQVRKHKI